MPSVVPPVGQLIGEEGTSLTRRPTLNFIGSTVTAADNAASNRTDITVTSGSTAMTGPVQVVSTLGSDSDNGSWGAPKLTVHAAVAALPNGGTVFVLPGDYTFTSTLTLGGHSIIGLGSVRNDLGYTYSAVRFLHGFSGHLVSLGTAGWGVRLENVCLYENTYNQGGAALYAAPTPSVRGYLYLNNIQITGYGFTEGIYIDASAVVGGSTGGGFRSTFITNTYVFGCVNYNFYANGLLHAWINGVGFNPAVVGNGYGTSGLGNAAGKAYVTIANAASRDINMHAIDLQGDLACAGSASSGVSPNYFSGTVTGNVTFSGAYNHFRGLITGTFTASGAGGNQKYLNEFTGTLT